MTPSTTASLTSDARDALATAGFSRRDFLKRSGALVVTFSAAGVVSELGLAPGLASAQGINNPGPAGFVDCRAADGRVTACRQVRSSARASSRRRRS
jgi:hypothetical protein